MWVVFDSNVSEDAEVYRNTSVLENGILLMWICDCYGYIMRENYNNMHIYVFVKIYSEFKIVIVISGWRGIKKLIQKLLQKHAD